MAEKKIKKTEKVDVECNDKFCPWHGADKLKMRGRTFEGNVIRKLPGRVTIEFERMIKLPKYERYEKRRTKVHARLTDCMRDEVSVGDRIEVAETRPVSKMIHFVVSKVVRKRGKKE
jgi:small subunit ribosomal protein S17